MRSKTPSGVLVLLSSFINIVIIIPTKITKIILISIFNIVFIIIIIIIIIWLIISKIVTKIKRQLCLSSLLSTIVLVLAHYHHPPHQNYPHHR